MHEWSLLLFTVCLQGAIGIMFFITLFQNKLKALSTETIAQVLRLPLIVTAVLSFVGLIASFTHLGKPTRAINTLFGFGRSWMSNEIVVTSAFIGLVFVCVGLLFLKKKVFMSLISVSAALGLIDVFCMAKIYSFSLVDGWNNLNTFTSFYGTTFVLGAIFFMVLVVPSMKKMDELLVQSSLKWTFVVATIGIGIQLIGLALFFVQDTPTFIIDSMTWTEKLAPFFSAILIRWIVELVAIVSFGYVVLSSKGISKVNILYVTLVLLIGAELANRYLFYVLGA